MPTPILVEYEQTVQLAGSVSATHEPLTFAALVEPVLVRRPKGYRLLTQSGSAVAWFGTAAARPALFPDAIVGDPQVSYQRLDDIAARTTWSYVMAVADDQWADAAAFAAFALAATAWPTSPVFLSAGPLVIPPEEPQI